MSVDEPRRVGGWDFQDAAPDWRVLSMSGTGAWFDAPSYDGGIALARRIVDFADSCGVTPSLDLRASGVQVWIPYGEGLDTAKLSFAQGISAAARELGLTSDPSVPQNLEWGIDTLDKPTLLPFWQTLLGYEEIELDDLVDPLRRDPRVWFYEAAPRPLRNRIHFDVAVPREVARDRAAAIKAGPDYAPDHGKALLRDAEGNEVDYIPAGGLGLDPDTADWWLPFGGMVFYPTDDLGLAVDLAGRVASTCDEVGLPLLIDLRPSGVMIDTGKDQWEDQRFTETARRVQAHARELGLAADPTRLRFFQVCIDAVDIPAVRAFWRAVLGYVDDPREFVTDIGDPRRLNHPMIFQQMDPDDTARREQRNRIHLDLYLPHDQVAARIDAALAAGGRFTREPGGTIADPEGNEVDIGRRLADPTPG
ncbi:VOC family protein [Microlunatus sp. GCM10028923]|uniref:VOC family protein n=1 Tax=Microlunatus sp. GCM10028923 TaxID=3273400 RepID=UPI00360A5044